MTTVPPGWYDDGHGGTRWWDGARWTEHVAVPDVAETLPSGAGTARSPYWGGDVLVDARSPASARAVEDPAPVDTPGTGAATRRSRRWILGGAVGAVVVVVGIAIAATSLGGPSVGHTNDGPANDTERAAYGVVFSYFDAVHVGDCETFFAVTTESFRRGVGVVDCQTFTNHIAGAPYAGAPNYGLWVPSIEQSGGGVVIETTETYSGSRDTAGSGTSDSREHEDRWRYTLVPLAGSWAIDSLESIQ